MATALSSYGNADCDVKTCVMQATTRGGWVRTTARRTEAVGAGRLWAWLQERVTRSPPVPQPLTYQPARRQFIQWTATTWGPRSSRLDCAGHCAEWIPAGLQRRYSGASRGSRLLSLEIIVFVSDCDQLMHWTKSHYRRCKREITYILNILRRLLYIYCQLWTAYFPCKNGDKLGLVG